VQGHYLAIATLGFALFVQQVLFEWEALTGGRQGLAVPRPSLFGIELDSDFSYYYLLLAIFFLLAWIAGNFARSHTGRALAALRMSAVAAECCGIARPRHIIIAFVVSAFFTGRVEEAPWRCLKSRTCHWRSPGCEPSLTSPSTSM
jgi:branched-chain amino acid transport system permease protein